MSAFPKDSKYRFESCMEYIITQLSRWQVCSKQDQLIRSPWMAHSQCSIGKSSQAGLIWRRSRHKLIRREIFTSWSHLTTFMRSPWMMPKPRRWSIKEINLYNVGDPIQVYRALSCNHRFSSQCATFHIIYAAEMIINFLWRLTQNIVYSDNLINCTHLYKNRCIFVIKLNEYSHKL